MDERGIYTKKYLIDIASECAKITLEKNKAYGGSYAKVGEFLALLYPHGVGPKEYGSMLTLARIFDKLMRVATNKDAFGESPYKDIIGYCLLELQKEELDGKKREGEALGSAQCKSSDANFREMEDTTKAMRDITGGF